MRFLGNLWNSCHFIAIIPGNILSRLVRFFIFCFGFLESKLWQIKLVILHFSMTLSYFLSLFMESRFWSFLWIFLKICHLLVLWQVLAFPTVSSFSSSGYEITVNSMHSYFSKQEAENSPGALHPTITKKTRILKSHSEESKFWVCYELALQFPSTSFPLHINWQNCQPSLKGNPLTLEKLKRGVCSSFLLIEENKIFVSLFILEAQSLF